MLSEVERGVLAAVDDARIVADLRELVKIPSVDGTAEESEIQGWVAERLRGVGLEVDHWQFELPAVAGDPEFPGWEVERAEAWGCVGVTPGGVRRA